MHSGQNITPNVVTIDEHKNFLSNKKTLHQQKQYKINLKLKFKKEEERNKQKIRIGITIKREHGARKSVHIECADTAI